MSRRGPGALALACALAAACSTLNVSTDYDRTVDFTRFRTFEMRMDQGMRNQLMRGRAESAIVRELEAKGLRRVDDHADLWVAVHARTSREKQIDTTRFGYGWGRWGYWGGGVSTTTVRQVPVGTVIVDLVDGAERKLVWQAVASDVLDSRATAAERDEAMNKAMAKVFAEYPPKAK
jgi:hypothetical protein